MLDLLKTAPNYNDGSDSGSVGGPEFSGDESEEQPMPPSSARSKKGSACVKSPPIETMDSEVLNHYTTK